jgi:hypothetical protein
VITYSLTSEDNDPAAGTPSPPQQGDLVQIEAFLRHWFGAALSVKKVPDQAIVLAAIVRLKKDRMGFARFENIQDAARWAAMESARSNLYFHAALHGHCPRGKGSLESAVCLSGVIADLDAQSPYRGENEGKAPSVESLYSLVRDFENHYPFRLTLIESGYGIYPSIRFREPLFLTDQRTRDEAGELLNRFAEAFRILARARGWLSTTDRVSLAGLVRLPGTFNRKRPSPLPVRLVTPNGGVR